MGSFVELDRKKVQTLRTKNCWSQEELASAAGLSIRTVQRVEKTGNASLETIKALASVFTVAPLELQNEEYVQHATPKMIWKYGWIVAFVISSILFGFWVVDILIPTLKGADFNDQYELHNNFRYLDFGGISFIIGFVWLVMNMLYEFLGHTKKRELY